MIWAIGHWRDLIFPTKSGHLKEIVKKRLAFLEMDLNDIQAEEIEDAKKAILVMNFR